MTGWLAGKEADFVVWQDGRQAAVWLADRLAGRTPGWPACRLEAWLAVWQAGRLAG